ncbi:MAG: hypothetical protein MJZ26_12150 [Fibrobacter sp.]|nr:hypothetical protein [Fibrobacter sp.]
MNLYMEVSKDEYELPLVVTDSVRELAEITGVKESTISSTICLARKRGSKSRFVKVEVDE